MRKDNKLTMINYETIISNFDDKVTLYNWLRKVEEALKNASATNFVVNKKGNATLSFSITFADGETLESGDIVLQQGESVDDARIAGGILQLHLTNGTWLTAGNIKPVSNFSIDANQHLIVNYQDGTSQDLGAIFNGNVNIDGNFTANSIIENMTGYSAYLGSITGLTIENVYTGAVKNGNKLTLVGALKLTRTSELPLGSQVIMTFAMPNDVRAKLYPTTIGGYGCLSFKRLKAVNVDNNTMYDLDVFLTTAGTSSVQVFIQGASVNNLPLNTEVYLRIEDTYLLSDNLIGA